MSSAPDLQQKLFKQMGIDVPEPTQKKQRQFDSKRPSAKPLTRKDERKAQRQEKKTNRYSRPPVINSQPRHANGRSQQPKKAVAPVQKKVPQPVVVPKKRKPVEESEDDFDDDEDMDGLDEDDEDEGFDDESDADLVEGGDASNKNISKSVKDKLAQDDAEIEAFERKLGIKKGRKSLPQSFKEDGLGDLLGELGPEGGDSEEEDEDTSKRKRDYDDWLASKRRKVAPQQNVQSDDDLEDGGSDDMSDMMDDDENPFDDVDGDAADGLDDDDSFGGFDSDGDAAAQPKQKENPYVAPTTGTVVARYVPPSLRKAANGESEQRSRLQKNIQGLINRLTDANILSIVQSAEQLYQNNARGDVTEVMIEVILAQICKPETLPDQFFVLTGGFTATLYKVNGAAFGSHVLRRLVKEISDNCAKAKDNDDTEAGFRKEAANLVAFLTQLYVFEAVSCRLVFDFMERFLEDLTELNVELLLRICRTAGRLLRRDDPQALKHIASVLNKGMTNGGYENVSVRTKFMVETINDLKNSKPKAKGLDSAVVSDHVQRMKKRIGELKSQTRRFEGLAPMGVSLSDIEGADTQGKWWLVGASVPVKTKDASAKKDSGRRSGVESDDEDMDFVLPDYPQKARAQGFSTMSQVAIFTALMSALNYEHGYRQFLDLKLKKDDQLEIARVLVQCVGSEAEYNEYYSLVARQACANGRIRFAFQDRLWRLLRGLGESLFGDEAEDDDTADSERMKDEQRLSHTAHFYASLVAGGALSISVLKPLDLPEVNSWTSSFVEHFMVSLLRLCKGKGEVEDAKINKVFGPAKDLPGLAAGIHWFLRKRVRKTKLVSGKEAKKLDRKRNKAQAVVAAVGE